MWEFSAIISREHTDLSMLIWNKIEELMKTYKGVIIKNTKDSISIIISIPKKQKNIAMAMIKDILSEAIVLYFKAEYLKKNMQIPVVSEKSKNALFKALAVFDKKTDIDFVKKELYLTKKLHLDSFFEFRLNELRLRWHEICELMQDNVNYLLLTDSFNDLTRYLIRSTEPEFESIYVYISDNTVIIRDKVGNKLCEPISLENDNFESNVITELIYLSPKNIFFKFDQSQNKKLVNDITELFMEKVCNKC